MLMILNNNLYHAQLTPLIEIPFRIAFDPQESQFSLFCGSEKVEIGVIWHGYGCRIDGMSGKVLAITEKNPKVRAVFGRRHLDHAL